MPLTGMADLMHPAARSGSGVGAFNVVHLEHAEALVAGAADAGVPVILQISENTVRYHGGLEPLGLATLAIARRAPVPVTVHLDHAESIELVHTAVDLGFPSVMFDGSTLDYPANVARTRQVVEHCHHHGVWVEAELGEIGGKDGAHAPGVRTDPAEARDFITRTSVDALAVAVGSSHAMLTRTAALDFELIRRLARTVPVPLVLHGSSGVADDDLREGVRAGITKVNIATRLNQVFTEAVRTHLAEHRSIVDTRRYLGAGRCAVRTETARLLELLAANGPHEPSAPAQR